MRRLLTCPLCFTARYNDSVGGSCQDSLADVIYVGVRCLHPIGTSVCRYNITATALPHELYDGVDLIGSILPSWMPLEPFDGTAKHYYRVTVGEYDQLRIIIERFDDGRPLKDDSSESLGVGFAGGICTESDILCVRAYGLGCVCQHLVSCSCYIYCMHFICRIRQCTTYMRHEAWTAYNTYHALATHTLSTPRTPSRWCLHDKRWVPN